jgi:hypothetical protein
LTRQARREVGAANALVPGIVVTSAT